MGVFNRLFPVGVILLQEIENPLDLIAVVSPIILVNKLGENIFGGKLLSIMNKNP